MTDREMPPPGPARDGLVAEWVMGYTLHADGYWETRDTGEFYRELPYEWSTDNHAATDVLLEMQRQGWLTTYELDDAGGHTLWLRKPQYDWRAKYRLTKGEDSTFPDAITAGALRAAWAAENATGECRREVELMLKQWIVNPPEETPRDD